MSWSFHKTTYGLWHVLLDDADQSVISCNVNYRKGLLAQFAPSMLETLRDIRRHAPADSLAWRQADDQLNAIAQAFREWNEKHGDHPPAPPEA